MSKIGKKTIKVPAGVQIQVQDDMVSIKGPKGELKREVSRMLLVAVQGDALTVSPVAKKEGKYDKLLMETWGLTWALVRNMIVGVSEGFTKSLEFQGVGFKAAVKGTSLEMNIGFSHPVIFEIPKGIAITVEKNIMAISGIDKEQVGQVAAKIRSYKEPEPYKGSGIRYVGEIVRKKAGKKAVAAGG